MGRVRGSRNCCSDEPGRGERSVGPGAIHERQRRRHCNHRLHHGRRACRRRVLVEAVVGSNVGRRKGKASECQHVLARGGLEMLGLRRCGWRGSLPNSAGGS